LQHVHLPDPDTNKLVSFPEDALKMAMEIHVYAVVGKAVNIGREVPREGSGIKEGDFRKSELAALNRAFSVLIGKLGPQSARKEVSNLCHILIFVELGRSSVAGPTELLAEGV
jgi:hypothetical protein